MLKVEYNIQDHLSIEFWLKILGPTSVLKALLSLSDSWDPRVCLAP